MRNVSTLSFWHSTHIRPFELSQNNRHAIARSAKNLQPPSNVQQRPSEMNDWDAFRCGGATAYIMAGKDGEAIKGLGRWNSYAFHLYFRDKRTMAGRVVADAEVPYKKLPRERNVEQLLDAKRILEEEIKQLEEEKQKKKAKRKEKALEKDEIVELSSSSEVSTVDDEPKARRSSTRTAKQTSALVMSSDESEDESESETEETQEAKEPEHASDADDDSELTQQNGSDPDWEPEHE
ncbi:hypothetical protein JCM10296v2_000240 [Rhodotorula toruloides]